MSLTTMYIVLLCIFPGVPMSFIIAVPPNHYRHHVKCTFHTTSIVSPFLFVADVQIVRVPIV